MEVVRPLRTFGFEYPATQHHIPEIGNQNFIVLYLFVLGLSSRMYLPSGFLIGDIKRYKENFFSYLSVLLKQ